MEKIDATLAAVVENAYPFPVRFREDAPYDVTLCGANNTTLMIKPDGRVIAGPGLVMDDVARSFLAACSAVHQRQGQDLADAQNSVTSLLGLLAECRSIIAAFGLRSTNLTFWRTIDQALAMAPVASPLPTPPSPPVPQPTPPHSEDQ